MRVRFVVFSTAVGLILLLLVAKPFAHSEPPYWTLRGTTDQGEDIMLRLDLRGRVRTFHVSATLQCDVGSLSPSVWEPSEGGAPARFRARGPGYFYALEEKHFREYGTKAWLAFRSELRGTVSRGHASGTVALTTERGPRGLCSSGRVRWAAD